MHACCKYRNRFTELTLSDFFAMGICADFRMGVLSLTLRGAVGVVESSPKDFTRIPDGLLLFRRGEKRGNGEP